MNLEIGSYAGYRLLDSGDGRKLELFGGHPIDRPCPQAIWPAGRAEAWAAAAAAFQRQEGGTGSWEIAREGVPEAWGARMGDLSFEIRLTGFGNVGLFPEHAAHWDWVRSVLGPRPGREVLNLFAYTGGASMACALAGATVTHVDSARAVNGWAMRNAAASGVPPDSIRYLAEDATRFARREQRRGKRYHGIVLDPPTFGRGAKGEVWKIERDLFPLIEVCAALLSDEPAFVLLTAHSPGVTPTVLRTLLVGLPGGRVEAGEMLLTGPGAPIPAGVYARWTP
jgi:23S rRNA (cytosine1962-C5)-methyltransferase